MDLPEDDDLDIPMMDAPDPVQDPSPAQRFSIVDVLRHEAEEAKDMTTAARGASSSATDPMHSNLYECDEAKVLQRLKKLYPHTEIQKLPRHWNRNDRWMPGVVAAQQQAGAGQNAPGPAQVLELSSDFLRVTKRKGDTKNSKDAAAVRANRPIPRSCIVFYFEMTVVNKGTGGYMGIGLSEKGVSLNRLPGWDKTSYGYHGDDGNFFASVGKGVEYGPTFTTGDVVGCGLNFVTRQLFFTKNGKHLGVANTEPIPLVNDLYPTVGMQTADEMIDANFGQRPFVFDVFAEMNAAEQATKNAIAAIELPPEKVLWMNSLIAKWMTYEGYSRALEALNRSTANAKSSISEQAKEDLQQQQQSPAPTTAAETVANSVMQSIIVFGGGADGGTDAAAPATTTSTGSMANKRRTVVRSVQEALDEEMEHHDKMDQRRSILRMVKRGQLDDAISHIEHHYPTLMETNRQLALLLKIQQFIEMLSTVSREMPSSPAPNEQQPHYHHHQAAFQHNSSTSSIQPQHHHHHLHHHQRGALSSSHSPSSSPRPSSSSRGGKRAAASSDEDGRERESGSNTGAMVAGTSATSGGAAGGGGTTASGGSGNGGHLHHNAVKRRSSDDDCSSLASNDDHQQQQQILPSRPMNRPQQPHQQQQQNGNSLLPPPPPPSALAQMVADGLPPGDGDYNNSFMDTSEDSRDGGGNPVLHAVIVPYDAADLMKMANGGGLHYDANNGNMLVLVGTPPTSTTIIDEPVGEIDLVIDGVTAGDFADEQHQQEDAVAQHGGFTNAEERDQFERYRNLLEFGHHISQFALKTDAEEGPCQGSAPLRQRMNEAFSLLCYPDPTQSVNANLFDQIQRDLVAKALNAAILEMEGGDTVSPLDKCFRRARYIRDQALAFSASAVFADPNQLFAADCDAEEEEEKE
ncbi:hypothetical protein niasHS_014473 [Heterodera schachtii]|uniref:Ran-binding protein n=1 Tax=Heterodera schachtii TaxID=97005 RepID=A0ABD2IK43_HETSC